MRAIAVRWVADEPFPGVVEVQLTDADGRPWSFVDKAPIFDGHDVLNASAKYPIDLEIACTVLDRLADRVVVTTAKPWGIETVDRQSRFVVRLDQLG